MYPEDVGHLIHEWHTQEDAGVLPRLRAMNMFPSFFSPISPGLQIKQVDVRPILGSMQDITDAFDLRYSELTPHVEPYHLWASSGPSRLLSAVIDAHLSSIKEHSNDALGYSQDLKSSWSGICLAVGLYLTSVLGIWNQGRPAENRLLHHILRILGQDLEDNLADVLKNDTAAQDLWFWKAFSGALSLAHVESVAGGPKMGDARLLELIPDFNRYVWTWTESTGISVWERARDRLENIVFPMHFQREALAKALWNRALSGSE
jgi:hypothetical protein